MFFAVALAGQARAGDIDWTKVDAVLGGVHRYGISDLQVTLDGVAIKPTLALGGWFGFAAELDLDTGALDQAIGVKGKVDGGVYQFSVPRKDEITENGVPVPPAMGTAMVINFQPTGGGKAVITGDFVVSAPRGESPPPRPPRIRHRGDGGPQPHAGRDAAALLRAFLGQRRRDETR